MRRVASGSVPSRLAEQTTLRLGGPPSRLVTADSQAALVAAVRAADAAGEALLLIGGGSNVVVADAGWPGVAVLVRSGGIEWTPGAAPGTVLVTAQAGVRWDELVELTIARGWSGLASMSGIPGSVGATPVQNVGAYGSEVADTIAGLTVLDRQSGQLASWSPEQCGFGFRSSAFKHTDRYVVLDVTFLLEVSELAAGVRYLELARRLGVEPGQRPPSSKVREVVLELRASKGMLLDADDHDTWSVGSFFTNPVVSQADLDRLQGRSDGPVPHFPAPDGVKLAAAWLVEHAGFGKGFPGPQASATLSTKHSLALTNRGTATARDVVALARVVRDGVHDAFGITLIPEPVLVGVTI